MLARQEYDTFIGFCPNPQGPQAGRRAFRESWTLLWVFIVELRASLQDHFCFQKVLDKNRAICIVSLFFIVIESSKSSLSQ